MNERAVQIHSTSRGGSTFLAFMLANKLSAIAPGDIRYLFRPHEESQKRTSCVCPDPNCTIWADAKEKGEKVFYQTMFDKGYDWVIDSAKHVDWFTDQKQYNPNLNIHDIIIFKSPSEFGHSFFKRIDSLNLRFYVQYYLQALANTNNPTLVEYKDLAQNPSDTLKRICHSIDMDYIANKELYWNKEDWHTWGGSNTAMLHFFDKDSSRFDMIVDDLKDSQSSDSPSVLDHYREIYYANSGDKLPDWGYDHINSENGLEELYNYMQKIKI